MTGNVVHVILKWFLLVSGRFIFLTCTMFLMFFNIAGLGGIAFSVFLVSCFYDLDLGAD